MAVVLNAYLNFKDNAREAMEFYQSVFGGKLQAQTFKELNAAQTPEEENLVMHSALEGDNGISFFAADTPPRMEYRQGTNFSMSLSGDDEPTLRRYFDALAAGGNVFMPLQKAIWGDTFGMLSDRFGVSWVVNITGG